MKKCRFCGKELPDDSRFCLRCGHEIKDDGCPHCGFENLPEEALFCPACGKAVKTVTPCPHCGRPMLAPAATVSPQQSVPSTAPQSQLLPVIQRLINNMVYVQGGTFTMGATAAQQSEAYGYEMPVHHVTLSSFSIGKYEVTQEEWVAVMGTNPSTFKGFKRPVEEVSWSDCQVFIGKLNKLTGKRFHLPTEAEWEFAARGGNLGKYNDNTYAGSNNIDSVAWYNDNSGKMTRDVGTKSPNELGLYDMCGNVSEWCDDEWYNYISSTQTNPLHPGGPGSSRVIRGGSWNSVKKLCRLSARLNSPPTNRHYCIGLRLAL